LLDLAGPGKKGGSKGVFQQQLLLPRTFTERLPGAAAGLREAWGCLPTSGLGGFFRAALWHWGGEDGHLAGPWTVTSSLLKLQTAPRPACRVRKDAPHLGAFYFYFFFFILFLFFFFFLSFIFHVRGPAGVAGIRF
jgi:hypothetical protein